MSHWPKEIIEKIKKLYGIEYYNQTINAMLVYEDEDLKDKNIMTKMTVYQSFLRTIFLLFDDDTIMDLNSKFHDLIDDDKMQKVFSTREEVVEMIINAYRKVKNDKNIPKIISLKL